VKEATVAAEPIEFSSDRIQRWLAVVTILSAHAVVFTQNGTIGRILFSALLILAVGLRLWSFVPCSLLLFLMSTSKFYFPSVLWNFPAVPFLVPFLLTSVLILPFPQVKPSLRWFRFGEVDKLSGALIVATGLFSTAALIAWGFWTDNFGIAVTMAKNLMVYSPWLILGIGIPVFALVNAFSEEVVYRGVIQEALAQTFERHSQWWAIVLQASAFAAIHLAAGFPNGKLGYLMVLVYGIALGYLRKRGNGMLAPYITHVIADLTIGYFLYFEAMKP
jgi:membrane protease YdiL (CAAX protease family)